MSNDVRPTMSLASAFGLQVQERIQAKVAEQARLGGSPIQTWSRSVRLQALVDELAVEAKTQGQVVEMARLVAARQIASAAARMFDTMDPAEVLAQVALEIHLVAFALGAQADELGQGASHD